MSNEGPENIRVKRAIKGYLERQGFDVTEEEKHADLVARRGEKTLVIEVQAAGKGKKQSVTNQIDRVIAKLVKRSNDFAGADFALGLSDGLVESIETYVDRRRYGWHLFVVNKRNEVSSFKADRKAGNPTSRSNTSLMSGMKSRETTQTDYDNLLDKFGARTKRHADCVSYLQRCGYSYSQANNAVYNYRRKHGLIGS
ncbi:MAG: hypothetical protein OEW70_03495 [candidate division WOR-3 bacterium]|nr:hypothetical protein [candidate division WOR-3 bacterium]